MREEPGERVFDIPEGAIPVRPAQPKAVPAKAGSLHSFSAEATDGRSQRCARQR